MPRLIDAIQASGLAARVSCHSVLASLKLRQGLVEEAARLVALAEARDPDVARLGEIKARLQQDAAAGTDAVP